MKILHHWFGIAFAAFFSVISLSGSWLVLDKYVADSLLQKEFRQQIIELSAEMESLKISQIIHDYPVGDLSKIEFPVKGRAAYIVSLQNGHDIYLTQDNMTEIAVRESSHVTDFMSRLHANLLDPWGIGHEIVIWTGLVAVFLSIFGVIIFIPQWRSFRRHRLLLPSELKYRDVRRTHLSSGLVFGVFIVFFSLTGWAMGDPADVRKILLSSISSPAQILTIEGKPVIAVDLEIEGMIDTVHSLFPEKKIAQIKATNQGEGRDLEVFLRDARDLSPLGYVTAKFDLETGHIKSVLYDADVRLQHKLLSNVRTFHTGHGRGIFYKILIAFLGVIVALVSFFGLLSYALKWRLKVAKTLARMRRK